MELLSVLYKLSLIFKSHIYIYMHCSKDGDLYLQKQGYTLPK